MKFLRHIIFMFSVVMLMPSTMVAQNVGEWQELYDTTNTYNMRISFYFNGKERDFSNFEIMFFVKDSITHKTCYYKPIIKDNCIRWNNIQEISEHIDVIYRYKKRYYYMPNCVFTKKIKFNLIINIDYKPYTVTKEKNRGVYTLENYETTYRNTRKHINKLAYKANVIGVNMLIYMPLEKREGYDYYSLLYQGESNKSKKIMQKYINESSNILQ